MHSSHVYVDTYNLLHQNDRTAADDEYDLDDELIDDSELIQLFEDQV